MKRYEFKDGTYAIVRELTALEWEDVEYDPNQPNSYAIACDIAYALEDWNGEGQKDPLELFSMYSQHLNLYSLSKELDKMKEIESLEITDYDTYYSLWNDHVSITAKPLTVFQFLDLFAQVQKNSKRGKSRQRCDLISQVVSRWHTDRSYTAEELYADRSMHKWVMAIEAAFSMFFRESQVNKVCDFERVLDNDISNGQHVDSEPLTVESKAIASKGFSTNLERIRG